MVSLSSPQFFLRHCPAVLALTVAFSMNACKRVEETMEIKDSREISEHRTAPKPLASSAERFYDTQPVADTAPSGNPLTWVTPAGWTEVPASSGSGSMRLVDLRFGEKGEGECYLSAIPGNAGGVEANVNRWRGQMGLANYTPEELEKLPKKIFLGRESVFVDFEGDFKGMGAAADAQKGFRLLGLVQPAPEFTLFVKMTGPKELVAQHQAAFEQFCQSISIKR